MYNTQPTHLAHTRPPRSHHVDWSLIVDEGALLRASRTLAAGHGPVGVDSERASGFRYGDDAYLIQMYRQGAGVFLFDPTAVNNFAPLNEAISHAEWVLHSAHQDLPCLKRLGLSPTRLFDTELAARLTGFARVGLGSMVEQLLNIQLVKEHSAADWSTRPLPEAWLKYAALDVALLPELRAALAAELAAQQKSAIAQQEFEAVRTAAPKQPDPEPWRKLSGVGRLRTPRQLALARELWWARETLAQTRDIAPKRLLPDSSILVAVMANPRTREALAANKAFTGRASRSELDLWWRALLRGKTAEVPAERSRPADDPPHHRSWPQRYPEAASRLALAREAIAAEARSMRMPPENMLLPDTLRRLVWAPPSPLSEHAVAERLRQLGARPWQCAATANILARACAEAPPQ